MSIPLCQPTHWGLTTCTRAFRYRCISILGLLWCGHVQCATLKYTIVATLPHDDTSFTQGLTYNPSNGLYYESTGLYGQSKVRKTDLKTNDILKEVSLDDMYFGEGITYNAASDKLIQITWKKTQGFVYNTLDLSTIQTFSFVGRTTTNEGWGITQDPVSNVLIVSDGSSYLHFWDPISFQKLRRLQVRRRGEDGAPGEEVSQLNELEFVNGRVLANVWMRDEVVSIDPLSGYVEDSYDFSKLYENRPVSANVLNGICICGDTAGEIYVTGKLWPVMFRVRIEFPPMPVSNNSDSDSSSTSMSPEVSLTPLVSAGLASAGHCQFSRIFSPLVVFSCSLWI